MKRLTMMGLLGLMVLSLAVAPSQANFVQCPGGGACAGAEGTTDDADLINGASDFDTITAQGGNDFAFGHGGDDIINGNLGNDVLVGGPDNDDLFGQEDNDILLPGPDSGPLGVALQSSNHGPGNDVTNVLATEITGCLVINDMGGSDTVNLLGFGPYSATVPFGIPDLGDVWIFEFDPITGGVIAIDVDGTSDGGVEVINGLTSPNVVVGTILPTLLCEPLG